MFHNVSNLSGWPLFLSFHFPWLLFVSCIEITNIDISYPLTKVEIKGAMSTFSKTFTKQNPFPLTLTVFHDFPWLFSDFFITPLTLPWFAWFQWEWPPCLYISWGNSRGGDLDEEVEFLLLDAALIHLQLDGDLEGKQQLVLLKDTCTTDKTCVVLWQYINYTTFLLIDQ